jgi:hypothetical protein
MYASPSRDARLKAAFRELHESVSMLPVDSPLRSALRTVWEQQTTQSGCQFAYRNSSGKAVPLTLGEVGARLFRLSFDAYHCPELRWGALPGSEEAASCPADAAKLDWYGKEQRLRNRIDRDYGAPTPIGEGPEEIPDFDVRRPLQPAP